MIKKALQGLLVSCLMLAVIAPDFSGVWSEPKILILIVMATLASIYQPDYSPFQFRAVESDRGTALQIIWSVYLTQALAVIESLRWRAPESLDLTPLSWLILAVSLFGLFLRTWSYLTLGSFFSWHISVQNNQRVVSSGPYRWLRHPSYTGAFLTYAMNPFFLGAPLAGSVSIFILFAAFYRRIQHEEVFLTNELGPEYVEFCRTRWRFLPFVW